MEQRWSTSESGTFETSRDARQGRGEAVAKLKFILDCHLFAADFDYLLKIRIGDIADFKRIHGDQLIALPGIRQSRNILRDEGGRR